MSHSERIADFILRFPGKDDDEISSLLKIEPRQTVNQICRTLASKGLLERRKNPFGKIGNYPLVPPSTTREPLESEAKSTVLEASTDATSEWFWEGNVTDAVAKYLREQNWEILSQADTRMKERGLDLHAKRGNREIVVEVKGYPSRSYRDQSRAGERKPTSPTLQAQHWYSHALLKAMRPHTSHPTAMAVVALPDFPRYRSLYVQTERALQQIGVAILFVTDTGQVEAIGL